ncbi:VOC family protein [Pararhizobium haloflavum]|uniref:VOC family protein n=1 Tax=Pararhizobium haloflavum TaxID=2037914 RepID=UPI000C1799DB|nr:VOC family protein [Pararhizobium haloflavum]
MLHSLDHLVLPVADLDASRERYTALGFTVAPRGEHPFGTENACVYFADDTFVEPLAIHQRETCEAEARAGNVFVARDQAFRFRRGLEGFSAIVMGTDDAEADHRAFAAAGISAGDMLTFSRAFRAPDGAEEEASFRLAFAADLRAPDAFFFTCQRINVPRVDRSALQRHDNGAMSISRVVAVEPNPTDFQYLLQDVIGQREVQSHSFGMDLASANSTISVLTPEGFRAYFGSTRAPHGRGLRFEGIVFGVEDLAIPTAAFNRNGISYRQIGERIVVDPAIGQGAFFIFEQE